MADRYWISNADSNANTASNWATNADGTGSSGVPAASDDVYIGHATTLAAGKGNGVCTWDITPTIDTMTVYEGYNSISETDTVISFTAPSTITHADVDWDEAGYRVGMKIVITGANEATNNATFDITAITNNEITISQTTLTTEAASASITVAYNAYLDVQADFGMNLLTLDGNIRNTSGSNNSITFSGTHASGSNNRYILNKSNQTATAADLTYVIDGSANGAVATYFDDGNYPSVSITGPTTISFGHKAPTSTEHREVLMNSFAAGSSVITAVDSSATPRNNQSRRFVIEAASAFSVSGTTFDAGKSTWEFQLDSASFAFPVSDDTKTYRWYNISITSKAAGRKATIPTNRTLSVNSITVGVNAVLEGHKTRGEASSTVVSVRRPKILGAWNFSQLSDGVYTSLMETAFPITPSQGASTTVQLSNGAGAFTNDENLSFASDTLTVDKGLKILEGADHPTAPAAGTGVLWVKNGAPNTLVFTDDAGTDTTLGSGGGGASYTDADAISAVEGEADLDLTGDVSLAANKELTINESTYSASSKNNDDTKVLVSADSTGTNDALFRVDTDAGFLRIGPQNTGYCHFYTDRSSFYFNRNIEMDGGSFQAYNDDLQILTTTTSGDATRIYVDAGVDECRVGIGNGFTSSNLPEKELHVRGNMVIEDPTSDGSSDHLLEIKSDSSSTPDNARILVSADTDAKLPLIHLRDIEANSGTFSTHYSAYIGLDRASPIVTGSAQNDLLIANGNYNKDIHFLTNPTSNGTQAQAKMTIAADGDVGIGTTTPAQKLDVAGTIRQSGATSSVLAANANGDIGAATALTNASQQSHTALPSLTGPAPPGAGDAMHGDVAAIHTTLDEVVDALKAFGIL
tara:strand:+ start:3758 stop:6352 length:2595 start_codon:yes stop_codon:yes gene_type:complete